MGFYMKKISHKSELILVSVLSFSFMSNAIYGATASEPQDYRKDYILMPLGCAALGATIFHVTKYITGSDETALAVTCVAEAGLGLMYYSMLKKVAKKPLATDEIKK